MMNFYTFRVYTYAQNAAHMMCGKDDHTMATIEAPNATEAYYKAMAMFPNCYTYYDGDRADLDIVGF